MNYRKIKRIVPSRKVNMDGIELDQPIPGSGIEHIDPFLLLHHWEKEMQPGLHPRDGGVGPHPHRGFSPVTFVFSGEVHHRDSRGNDSVMGPGGIQWINAGMGIIHSERQSREFAELGGKFEIIQLWINTPAAHKMDAPEYISRQADELPVVKLEEELGIIQVISGEFQSLVGPVKGKSELLILSATLKEGASFDVPVPHEYECLVYQLDGRIRLSDEETTYSKNLTWFTNDGQGNGIKLECIADGRALVLCGKPLREEVVKYGPFVMNSQTEIMEAMRDYRIGKMGMLIETF